MVHEKVIKMVKSLCTPSGTMKHSQLLAGVWISTGSSSVACAIHPLSHFFRAHWSTHGPVLKLVCFLRRLQNNSRHGYGKTRGDVLAPAPSQTLTQFGLDLNLSNLFWYPHNNKHTFGLPIKGVTLCTYILGGLMLVVLICFPPFGVTFKTKNYSAAQRSTISSVSISKIRQHPILWD